MTISRRDFLASTIAGSVSLGLQPASAQTSSGSQKGEPKRAAKLPVIICAANGYNYIEAAYESLASGSDTLDAALKVIQGPENDPNDESVGLGGHPNEEGVVELDACCMRQDRSAEFATSRTFLCYRMQSASIRVTSCWLQKEQSASL